jgi:AcrR family transcriptional regulator
MESSPVANPAVEARERILRAAEKLFAEKGYAATAVHEITDAAGVNRALLYYYFEDKRSLYASVIDEGTALFLRMLEESLATPGTYADRLRAFVRADVTLIWERGDLVRVVHRCLLDGFQAEVGLVERFREGMGRLEGFFREAIAAGEFRDLNPAIAARALLGPMLIFTLWRPVEEEPFAPEEIAEQLADQALSGLTQSRPPR